MESRQLKHFIAVAEHGHFTMAAKAMHIAQPALSISIKKLEKQLGLELFKRQDRKVTLTHEGEVLYKYAKGIIQRLAAAQSAMDELVGLQKGEVRLGVPTMVGSYYFPEIIMVFKSRYPEIKITIVDAGIESIKSMLLSGELGLGVILNNEQNEQNEQDEMLMTDPLLSTEMLAVVSDDHPMAAETSISFKDFFDNDIVTFKSGYFHRTFMEKVSKEYNYKLNLAFETNLLPVILNIVRRDFAITTLLSLVAEHEKGIVGIPFDERVLMNISLAWRKDASLSTADHIFIDFMKRGI